MLSKEDSIVELVDQYGVSRKTIYKWLARYEKRRLAGLADDSWLADENVGRDGSRDRADEEGAREGGDRRRSPAY